MANELNLSATLTFNKNGAIFTENAQVVATVAGDGCMHNVQAIGTATEAIVKGDVSGAGYLFVQNLDPTNYIELSIDNANSNKFAKLLPGDVALLKLSSNTLYATANTGACNLLVLMVSI